MSVLATLREAIRGSKQDFTDGPIARSLVLLAVPMVLETLLESLFAVVDIFFVAPHGSCGRHHHRPQHRRPLPGDAARAPRLPPFKPVYGRRLPGGTCGERARAALRFGIQNATLAPEKWCAPSGWFLGGLSTQMCPP